MALIIIKNLKEEYPEIVKDYIPYHEKLKANAMATPYSKPDTAEDNERFGTKANQFESADINDNGGRSIDHAADTGKEVVSLIYCK